MNFRLKQFISSLGVILITQSFFQYVFLEDLTLYASMFIASLFYYFIIFWLYNFEVTPEGFLTILFPPTLWFFFATFLYVNVFKDFLVIYRLLYAIIVSFFLYYFLATQNILNVNYFRSVSLSQAAKTAKGFFTVLLFFLGLLAIFSTDSLPFVYKILSCILVFLLVSIPYLFIFKVRISFFVLVSILFSFIILQIAVLYWLDVIIMDRMVILTVVITLIFKGSMTVSVYSVRDYLSAYDKFQMAIEGLIAFTLLAFVCGYFL